MVSTHTRLEMPGSASTIADFIAQAKVLGRSHVAYADMGRVTGLYKAYKAAKDANIGLIAGCEIPIVMDIGMPFAYYTVTVFCHDQGAYQKLGDLLSHPKGIRLTEGEHEMPYFELGQLDMLSGHNVSFNMHGLHSAFGKMLLGDKEGLAEDLLIKLKTMGDVSVSVVAAKEDSVIVEKIQVFFSGRQVVLSFSDMVEIDTIVQGKFKRIKTKAKELVDSDGLQKTISALYPNGVKIAIQPQKPTSVRTIKVEDKHPFGCANAAANKAIVRFAQKHGLSVFVSDNAYMAKTSSRSVQEAKLQGERLEADSLHMLTDDETIERLTAQGFGLNQVQTWIKNTQEWASKFNFKLEYGWRLPKIVEDEDKFVMDQIKKVGRMKWDDPKWVDRLNYELSIIRDNGVFNFLPYFVPITMVFDEYKKHGRIRSPGRGSVGGSLLAYCLGFTHVDPLAYNLPFERFFSKDRVLAKKLPDVDLDLVSRDLLVGEDGSGGLLKRLLGDKYAQISTRGNLRLKSSVQNVARKFYDGIVPEDIMKFSNNLSAPPQGVSDKDYVFGFSDSDGNHHKGLVEIDESLQDYVSKYPEQWQVVSEMLGVGKSYGRHASGFCLADIPIAEIVPTMMVKGHGPVTQYEAKEVESAGLIKYDFLVVNQLLDIENCIKLINSKNGDDFDVEHFRHNGEKLFVWDLPQDDPAVKSLVKRGDLSTVFQVHTQSMRPFMLAIQPSNIRDFAIVLALVRPGPLDFVDPKTGRNMAEEYVERRRGRSSPDIPALASELPETYGVIAYQEQISTIAKNIGKMSGERAEILRDNMCKKRAKQLLQMKPEFMAGAIESVGKETAETIWNQMETFAQYGFSVIHSTEYAMISYTCAFLKAHYPLEWWASILKNAEAKEIKDKLWKYVKHLVAAPDINLSNEDMLIDYDSRTIRNKLSVIRGLSSAGVEKLVQGRPYKDLQHLVDSRNVGDSMLKKLMHVGVLDSLLPVNQRKSLITKMTALEDSLNKRKYQEKLVEFAEKTKEYERGERKTKPKEPKAPEPALPDTEYLSMTPYKDITIRKFLMPSVEADITGAVIRSSPRVEEKGNVYLVKNSQNKTSRLLDGQQMQDRDDEKYEPQFEREYYACGGFVVSMSEFPFNKGQSRALKMLVDTDGYEREVVIWPDYETKQLSYPENLKENSIVILYYSRRRDKKSPYLTEVHVEYAEEKKKGASK